MSSDNYQLSTLDRLLHDYPDVAEPEDVSALVASGDCFITLATKLDDTLHEGKASEAASEEVIRILIYLQRHYSIVKKQPNYRQ